MQGNDDDQTRPVTERAAARQGSRTSSPSVAAASRHPPPRAVSSGFFLNADGSSDANARVVPAGTASPLRGEAALLAGGILDGRYRLVHKLGQGGMGAVYLVDDLLLRRRVALKTLRIAGGEGGEDLERFRKEAAITHAIHHPNVARTYDIGEEDGVHYMSMEWLDGETMMDRIRARGAFDVAATRALAIPLAHGLRAAHRAGIVHRDLKPANIMMVPDDRHVVVMDFGIAASVSETRAGLGAAPGEGDDISSPWEVTSAGRGTPAYMAPEQWDESHGDARTDIYAFGVILYVALTGKGPFKAKTTAELATHHRETPPPDVRAVAPKVDRDLAMLIQRCMAKRPQDRPRDMSEVLDLLERGGRRRAWVSGVATVALLTAVGTFAVDAAIYSVVSTAVLREMRPALARLATLVARDLPRDDLASLRSADDMREPAFTRVHRILATTKAANPEVKGLYVMRADRAPGSYRIVADAEPFDRDRDGDGQISDAERGAATGTPYDGSNYPSMQRTLDTGLPQTDEAFGSDAWGVSLSGYAPVDAYDGHATTFVGVDIGNAQLETLQRRLKLVLGSVAVLLVVASGVLTWPLAGGESLWHRLVRRRERDPGPAAAVARA